GSATFRDLVPGTKYYYKETKAPEGYRIPLNQDGSEIITEIYATSTPIQDKFSLFVNGVEHIATSQDGSVIVEGDKDNRVAGMTVVNDVLTKLPETGSNLMIPIILMGSFLMLFSLYLSIKSNKKIKYNGGN
ncbi:MAG: SpaA isopeptide-forming pilin-related protein, partial [Bacilli bacterium]